MYIVVAESGSKQAGAKHTFHAFL